jgi:hypothetical protein
MIQATQALEHKAMTVPENAPSTRLGDAALFKPKPDNGSSKWHKTDNMSVTI